MSKECFFCELFKNQRQGILWRDDKVLIYLDDDKVVKGHILVVWKDHHLNISELDESDYSQLAEVLYKAEKVILGVTTMKRSVILKSGFIASHLHFHIYPIEKDTSWTEVEDAINKRVKYEYDDNELSDFIREAKESLHEIFS